jgi:hypothetical protein
MKKLELFRFFFEQILDSRWFEFLDPVMFNFVFSSCLLNGLLVEIAVKECIQQLGKSLVLDFHYF